MAAAGIVAALCVAILRPFASVIAWSAVLAILCYPLQEALVRRTRRVALSALLTSLVTVLVCLVPLLVLAGVAVNEYAALVPRSFQGGAVTRASALIARITGPVGLSEPAVVTCVEQHVGDMARGAGQYAITIANGLFDAVISSVLVIVAMFLLLRDGKALVAAIPDFLPFERSRSEALLGRIKDVARERGAVVWRGRARAMFWVL